MAVLSQWVNWAFDYTPEMRPVNVLEHQQTAHLWEDFANAMLKRGWGEDKEFCRFSHLREELGWEKE